MLKLSEETSPIDTSITEMDCSDSPNHNPLVDMENVVEDKGQIELEVEIEKKGVPVIDVERPPIPNVQTDMTSYKQQTVKRKKKKVKEPVKNFPMNEDREMKVYAEQWNIKKRKGLFDWFIKKFAEWRCNILRFLLNYRRKRDRIRPYTNITREYSPDLKTVSLKKVTEQDLREMGRRREFQRGEDESNTRMNAIRNKKTGVVVMSAENASTLKKQFNDDHEIVESLIKG